MKRQAALVALTIVCGAATVGDAFAAWTDAQRSKFTRACVKSCAANDGSRSTATLCLAACGCAANDLEAMGEYETLDREMAIEPETDLGRRAKDAGVSCRRRVFGR